MTLNIDPEENAIREGNIGLVRRFLTLVMEQGLVEFCDELLHPDAAFVDPSLPPGLPNGPAGVAQLVQMIHKQFSSYTMRLDDIFAVGTDRVVNRFAANAIHEGGFFGSNLAGKSVSWTGNTVYRFKDGLIHRIWLYWDLLSILVQLGVVTRPTSTTPPPWVVAPIPGTPFRAAERRNAPLIVRPGPQSVPENIANVQFMFDGITSVPIEELVEQCIAPEYVRQDNCAMPGTASSVDGFVEYVRAARENFEGYRMQVDEIFGEGDKVVARVRATGLHRGGFMGVLQGGQRVNFLLSGIYRMAQGRIAQSWVTWDSYGALAQLGAVTNHLPPIDG